MKAQYPIAAAGALVLAMFSGLSPALAHHDFRAEFDASAPVVPHGKITGVEWVNPHSWIHFVASEPGKPDQQWMAEATSPNELLKAGVDRNSLAAGTLITLRGFRAKDKRCLPSAMDHQPTCKVAARALTFTDGRTALVYGRDCGPRDEADPNTDTNCPTYPPIPAGMLDGEYIYKARCASCHSLSTFGGSLAGRSSEQITAALATGVMRPQAADLSPAQVQALVSYMTRTAN